MTKQASISVIQQQLIQLEELGNKQLDGLLEQLEYHKSRLSVEDHPVIDWGISLIRLKLQEVEKLMEEVFARLHCQYGDYESFITESGWSNYALDEHEGQHSLYKSSFECLESLFDESCGIEHSGVLDSFVPAFKSHLSRFCISHGKQALSAQIVSNLSTHYDNRAAESEIKFNESGNDWDETYSTHYRKIADNLRQ
ncbi:MAG: hypothetical protein AAFW84_22595 [Cyanobacteria bacterium J06635_15]